jgi:hypothetical protein
MLEFFLLILTPFVLVDTILLFVIANKMTDGGCWVVTKKITKWGLGIAAALFGVAVLVTVIVDHWEKFKGPLGEVGEALLVLFAFWAAYETIRHGIVRPFLKGLRGR